MAKPYSITSTIPTVYVDKTGQAVNGWIVYFYFAEFDETHQVKVTTLDLKVVESIIKGIYDQRVALANLGKQA